MALERLYGLIGFPLSHSFSRRYFTEKFAKEGIKNSRYELFPLRRITELPALLAAHPDLRGLNVTIPYKEAVLTYLDEVSDEASVVGAVNTIKIEEGRLTGYNTDVYGFERSLTAFLSEDAGQGMKASGAYDISALILGTGGAAKAVAYVLKKLKIPFLLVSRKRERGDLIYEELGPAMMQRNRLIVNTTPLGMSPQPEKKPPIPYHLLAKENRLYDLVYNPEKTLFLEAGIARGCSVKNGLDMLALQAERAWQIWNPLS